MSVSSVAMRGVLRSAPWVQIAVTNTAAAALMVLSGVWIRTGMGLWLVVLGLATCAAAAAYVLDEDAEAVVAASPTSVWRRLTARATILCIPLGVGLLGLELLHLRDPGVPWVRLVLVLLGFVVLGVVFAAGMRRAGDPAPGDLAATVVAAGTSLAVVVDPLRHWARLMPLDAARPWGATALLWSAVLVCGCLTVAFLARDPASRRLVGRRPGTQRWSVRHHGRR